MAARRSLRTRLVVAFVLLALGALTVAGTTTYLLTRATAKQTAINDLQNKADKLEEGVRVLVQGFAASDTATAGRPRLRTFTAIAQLLNLLDARIVFSSNGTGVDGSTVVPRAAAGEIAQAFTLPDALQNHVDILRVDQVMAGSTVTGWVNSTAFLARKIDVPGTPALQNAIFILTAPIKTDVVGRAGPYFLLAAGITLLIAAGVAFWLARRMTRPLRDMQRTARTLAGGDLSARAEVGEHADDEVASLATTLNAMASQLEEARGSERAFLLSISHDLRTPLTSIRGYAEALADGTLDDSDPEARKRAAAVIQNEARRLERLVRDLLDLSRLDSRQFSLHPRPCDAAEVVAAAAQAFEPAARDMGVALHVARDGAAAADLDPERLAQIVANLVENALKYATENVAVSMTHDSNTLAIAVADDGPGVPTADLPHVFERLYTGRGAAGRAVGTGLGLAIVRELSHAMGGDVHAEANPTGGARFVVQLPAGS